MDSDSSKSTKEVEVLLDPVQLDESSEEPPMEEWSSLEIVIPEVNPKKVAHSDGLYDLGSGEICGKYIAMSDSSVWRHPYFNYPAITDPGIEKALLDPEKEVIYADDGQELYMATCKEMNQCPIGMFYRGLLKDKIDLRYYGVNPDHVRAMTIALQRNDNVKVFDLSDSFLNDDACYHLGELFNTNRSIVCLNLTGCRIGSNGLRFLLHHLHYNMVLKRLDLARNRLGDEAMEYLGNAIFFGFNVIELILSYNSITGRGVVALNEALEVRNKITHLDLSWNQLFTAGTYTFLMKLAESEFLQHLDLSWNSLTGLKVALGIKEILLCPQLHTLLLGHNQLSGEAITTIIDSLPQASKLVTLDLSVNPMSPEDAYNVLRKIKARAVRVKNVLMDEVEVEVYFIKVLEQVKRLPSKKDLVVTYGRVKPAHVIKGPDPRDLVLNRIDYITKKKSKKHPSDIALVMQALLKQNIEKLTIKELPDVLLGMQVRLDENLIEEFVSVFPGPKGGKIKTLSVVNVVEFAKRKWPNRVLPPTPPPEPEPEPIPVPAKKAKGKGKGKGKK